MADFPQVRIVRRVYKSICCKKQVKRRDSTDSQMLSSKVFFLIADVHMAGKGACMMQMCA